MNHLKSTSVGSLLEIKPKDIESQLIDYVMSLRNDGIAYATIQYLIAPIFTFYQPDDVVLNRKKVQRYIGEHKRVVKDKAYSTEQIAQALQTADQRMRMILLLLACTGCRIGALPARLAAVLSGEVAIPDIR
jgi:integrase